MAFIRPSLLQDASLVLKAGAVTLRPPQMADFFAWADLREASRAHLTPYEPQWTLDELSKSAYRERMKRYQRDIKEDQGYAFFVFAGADRALVGGITLANIRRGVAQTAAVGYWIGSDMTLALADVNGTLRSRACGSTRGPARGRRTGRTRGP